MKPFKTAEDIASITREDLLNASVNELTYFCNLQDEEAVPAFLTRARELLPDVVEMVTIMKNDYDKGKRSGKAFQPLLTLPPFAFVFAFAYAQSVEGGTLDAGYYEYIHKYMSDIVSSLFEKANIK